MSKTEEVREMRRREERVYNTAIIVMLALTALYFCWLGWMKARQPVVERAAYLEGRFGLDHATAMVYAKDYYRCEFAWEQMPYEEVK